MKCCGKAVDVEILIHHENPSGRCLMGPKFILQHDNEHKYADRVTNCYLQLQEEQGVLQQMVWPPQSPDFKIMESV